MQQSSEREEFGPFSRLLTGEKGPYSYEKPREKKRKERTRSLITGNRHYLDSSEGSLVSWSDLLCFHEVTDSAAPILFDHNLVDILCLLPRDLPAEHVLHDKIDIPVFRSVP
jgi:hypothetical protein